MFVLHIVESPQVFVRGLGTNILGFITRLCFASPQEFFQPSKRASQLLLSSSPFCLFVHDNLQRSEMRSAFGHKLSLDSFSKRFGSALAMVANRCSEHVQVGTRRSAVETVALRVLCRTSTCSLLFLQRGEYGESISIKLRRTGAFR